MYGLSSPVSGFALSVIAFYIGIVDFLGKMTHSREKQVLNEKPACQSRFYVKSLRFGFYVDSNIFLHYAIFEILTLKKSPRSTI